MSNYEIHHNNNRSHISEVPEGWKLKRLKYLTKSKKELSETGEEELLSVTETRGIIKRKELKSDDEPLSRSDDLIGYRLVEEGNLVNNIMLVWKRGLGVSPYSGIVSPAYSVFSFSKECDPWYFNYLLRSEEYITEFRRNSTGITMSRLRLYDDSFGDVFGVLPPLNEQKIISRYLDKKTSQIDKLISKIKKRIELLKEQRTSLINQYVTKGLDPNVEMKDSGIDWIGEIPKHWNIEVLKHISSVELSSVDRHEYEDEKRVNICHYPDVYKNEYIDSKSVLPSGTCSDNEFEKFSLRRGDILLTKDSESPDDIGIPTIVNEDLDNTVCGYHLAIIRMKSTDFHSEFIYRYIESKNAKDYFYVSSSGITRFGLGKGSIENLKVVAPPEDEQKQIAHKISMVSRTTKQLSERLLARKALLKEYRQSLISSVVTGKVRVTEEII